MKVIGFILIIYYCLLQPHLAKTQYYFYNENYYSTDVVWESGISVCLMNGLTDIGGRKGAGKKFLKDLNWQVSKPGLGFYVATTYKEVIGLKLEGTMGAIESYDSILKKEDANLIGRYGRNLSFKTSILEIQLAFEFHPLRLWRYKENKSPFWSPYLVAGVGYFYYNPKAALNGKWINLEPLRLEGQGFAEYPNKKKYRLNQINVPLGLGVNYELGPTLKLHFEVICRLLFTDYLDDVSGEYIDPDLFSKYLDRDAAVIARSLYSRMQELQPGYRVNERMSRGNAGNNDSFFTIQLKLGWVFRSRI